MSNIHLVEQAAQITLSVKNIMKMVSQYNLTKEAYEKSFSMIIALTSNDFLRGYAEYDKNGHKKSDDKTDKKPYNKFYIQEMIDNCIKSITSCDKEYRIIFEDSLTFYLDAVELKRKPERIAEMRRILRAEYVRCLGNDRAKYDERLMNQLDMIIQWAEGVGFKEHIDYKGDLKKSKEDEDEEQEEVVKL